MYINTLHLKNFRNYEDEKINFNKNINIIYGKNAQGKTNILEAIYLCATSKSYRTTNLKELINLEKEEAHIELQLNKNDIQEKLDIHIKKNNKKTIALNRIPIRKLNELFGTINVIMFSPEDLGLIKNGPKDRRRFINIELCQVNPLYYFNLKNYHKVLKQRNNLLKKCKINKNIIEQIEIWDTQLIEYGKNVITYRREFIEKMNPIFMDYHYKISGNKEKIKMIYDNNVDIIEFERKLVTNREKDIKNCITSVGPHRDDLKFEINNIDIRKYGSQGQQRTAALSLKLSEIEVIKNIIDDRPILLLDDVLSELDKNRQRYLLSSLKDIQTILTCTGIEDFLNQEIEIENMYHIENGRIKKQ